MRRANPDDPGHNQNTCSTEPIPFCFVFLQHICRWVSAQGSTATEWKECHAAALLIGKRGSEMADQMQRSACMLVIEYVPGSALFAVNGPFQAEKLEQTAADLGR